MLPPAFLNNSKEIDAVFKFFTSPVLDPTMWDDIVAFCKTHSVLKNEHDTQFCISLKRLHPYMFMFYAQERGMLKSVPIEIIHYIVEAMVDLFILIKLPPNAMNNVRTLYQPHDRLKQTPYTDIDILYNSLFGFTYIAEKYNPSVILFEVMKDKIYCGTGFYLAYESRYFIVTNEHVLKDCISYKIFTNKEKQITNIISKILDNVRDIAIIEIDAPLPNAVPLKLNYFRVILSEILTIGYPPIPMTRKPHIVSHLGEINAFINVPMFHKGEVNAEIEVHGLPYFIYSAKTNPGNSGSPVLDFHGYVIGMVTESLEDQGGFNEGKLPYHAAIKSEIIRDCLLEILKRK